MSAVAPTLRAVRARPVLVPMRRPLVTGGGAVREVPLVLVDIDTDAGITGSCYVFTYAPWALAPVAATVRALGELVVGDAVAPHAVERKLMGRLTLLGYPGFATMALAGLDMACWDIVAKRAGVALARLLGGVPRPIPAYNSCGLGLIGAGAAAREAADLLEGGFRAIKVRLGYPTLREDLDVARAVRGAVGADVQLMSDYNQCLTVPEAIGRCRALDAEGLAWIEEPTRFDDYAGHAAIAREAATPIQLGENCWTAREMAKALEARAADLFMPDAMKIGGVTGWLRAAALAEPAGVPLSTHLFPEVSAHLMAVTPTAHWLEYVDWAAPLLREPVAIRDGHAVVPDRPGIGIEWDEAAVARFAAG